MKLLPSPDQSQVISHEDKIVGLSENGYPMISGRKHDFRRKGPRTRGRTPTMTIDRETEQIRAFINNIRGTKFEQVYKKQIKNYFENLPEDFKRLIKNALND